MVNTNSAAVCETISPGNEDAKKVRPDVLRASPNESLLVGIILAFTALLYAPTLRFGFFYDDHLQIVQNPLVHFWRFVPEYFTIHVWQTFDPIATVNFFRTLTILCFRINAAMFG